MARKTINVKDLVEELNRRLTVPGLGVFEREAVCSVIEHVLLSTDQYAGFSYQPSEWDEAPTQTADGKTVVLPFLKPPGKRDEYRRIYYYAHN